jgi:ketosteroid isomerase-like protein
MAVRELRSSDQKEKCLRLAFLYGLIACGILAFAGACNDDGDGVVRGSGSPSDIAAIESVIRGNFAAVEANDFARVYGHSTADALDESFPNVTDRTFEGYERAFVARAADREGTRQPLLEFGDIAVESDRAEATVTTWLEYPGVDPVSKMTAAARWRFRKIEDVWKIDAGFGWTSARVPDGVTVIDVEASDFAWSFDASPVRSGNIAIRMTNVGETAHQLTLQRIPDDLDIEAWVRGADEPSRPVSEIGGSVPIEPGVTRDFTFTSPLPSGRYALLCFIEDLNDPVQPLHVEKGMWAELTVP